MSVALAHGSGKLRLGIALRAVFGSLLLLALIALPNDAARLREPILPALPLEWPIVLGLLLLVPKMAARGVRALVILFVALLVFIKIADMGTGAAFSRPFNLLLDIHLFVSGWHLLSGTVGTPTAVAAIGGAVLVFVLALILLVWGLRGLERLPARSRRWLGAACLAAALGGIALMAGDNAVARWVSVDATRLGVDRARLFAASMRDLSDFEAELADDPADAIAPAALLSGLAGKDVVFLFVESYGRSAVEGERYAPAVTARLAGIEANIATAGFSARSGWLTAPTVGGQSWLSHGTLLSGLWTDSQQRYDRLMVSRRDSLNALFGQAGWRTVALMPAITMDWPEGRWYGYDALYAKAGLFYRGDPFNWVTMPDQYTLSALNRFELTRADRPKIMAEIALISSHAPWTPIPPLLPWDEIGDGTVFNPYANSGDPPDVVWRDPERVRDQYALSIDYALETLGSYVETFGRSDLVFVVLGDHQPAPLVTGEGASRDVPVHLIAADPAVLDAVDGWGWSPGMVPAAGAPVWRMDDFRQRFLEAFSVPAQG